MADRSVGESVGWSIRGFRSTGQKGLEANKGRGQCARLSPIREAYRSRRHRGDCGRTGGGLVFKKKRERKGSETPKAKETESKTRHCSRPCSIPYFSIYTFYFSMHSPTHPPATTATTSPRDSLPCPPPLSAAAIFCHHRVPRSYFLSCLCMYAFLADLAALPRAPSGCCL